MKNLLLALLTLLVSGNLWTQVTTLSCESSEYFSFYNAETVKSQSLASLKINSKTKEITFRSITYDYKEVGNLIKFSRNDIDKFQTNSFSYTLDRISGRFTAETTLIQTGGKNMGTLTEYNCVQSKPLF